MLSVALLALLGCEPELPPGECENADLIESFVDADGDGFGDPASRELVCVLTEGLVTDKSDCDDQRSLVYPGALEICDGIDNDCDDRIDDGLRELVYYEDLDGDGFGNFDETTEACTPPLGYVENRTDCDDLNNLINPAAREICNGETDDNCNGKSDDLDPTLDFATSTVWYYDSDDDGYGGTLPLPFPEQAIEQFQLTNPIQRCARPIKPAQLSSIPGNFVGNVDDCDDENPLVSPTGTEVCNLIDDDCDRLVDDSDPDLDQSELNVFYADSDRDGAGDASSPVEACFQPWFTAADDSDCDDENPLLQDATGWWIDGDADGFGAGALSADSCVAPTADHVLPAYGEDCDDESLIEYPGAPELCDGLDNDCDGLTDIEDGDLDVSTAIVVYRDVDGDGRGDPLQSGFSCSGAILPGFVDNADDCDDDDANIFIGAIETCNGVDDDCDTLVDTDDVDVDLATAPSWWLDLDGDQWGDRDQEVVSCEQPNLYVGNDLDCDDGDNDVGPEVGWWLDGDGDTFGAGSVSAVTCDPPSAEHVPAVGDDDCDDASSAVFPGAEDECGDGIDSDCNGLDGGPQGCMPDTCADAELFPVVTSYFFEEVDLGGFGVDLPTLGCIGNLQSRGDAFIPVQAEANDVIRARVSHPSDDVYVALVRSCSNGTTCEAGSNLLASGNEQVEFEVQNGVFDGFVVAGCRTDGGCTGAEVEIEILNSLSWLAETCGDLSGGFIYTTGAYTLDGTLSADANFSLPSASSCTNYHTDGPEVFLNVNLADGERIKVSYDTPNRDNAIYLLTTCGQANSCVDGEDAGPPEEINFRNTSGASRDYTLGLDCYATNCDEFTATITIE
jgi:hypothetical protein